jgi:hypothetical protein
LLQKQCNFQPLLDQSCIKKIFFQLLNQLFYFNLIGLKDLFDLLCYFHNNNKYKESVMQNRKFHFIFFLILIINFIGIFCTGIILIRMPCVSNPIPVFGLNRTAWGSVHVIAGFIFLLLTLFHFLSEINKTKAMLSRHFNMGTTAIIIILILIIFSFGFLFPNLAIYFHL